MPANVPTNYALVFVAVLFLIGFAGVMARRNLVFMLMSVEIMLNAAAIAFIAAASRWNQADGQVFVIFILVTAAAEVAVGLALVLRVYHSWKNVDADDISLLRG